MNSKISLKLHSNPLFRFKPLVFAITSSLVLAACGGSSEDPFKPNPNPTPAPTPTNAAHCFDNALNYSVGNTVLINYLDYAQTDESLQPSQLTLSVTSNNASFNNQTGLILVNEKRASVSTTASNAWQSEQASYVRGPIPASGIASTVGSLLIIDNSSGTRISERAIVYQPLRVDQRRTLETGQSQTAVVAGTQQLVTAATSTEPAKDESTQFNRSLQITYNGDETLSLNGQELQACKFTTVEANQANIVEWIYRGLTLRKEVGSNLREEVTAISIQL